MSIVVENVFGSPDLTPETPGSIDEPFMEVSLHDNFTISKSTGTTGGPARGTETDSILTEDGGKIGVARVRSFDTAANNSTVTDFLSNSASIHIEIYIKAETLTNQLLTKICHRYGPGGLQGYEVAE